MNLREHMRNQYKQNGYAVFRRAIDMCVFDGYAWPDLNFIKFFERGEEVYRNALMMNAKNMKLQRLFLSRVIIQSLGELGIFTPMISHQPIFHVMSPNLRISDGYYGTAAHQDWPSMQGSLDCVTVWIALTNTGIGNFPLEVIPGSHKQGLREGKLNGSVLEVEANDAEFIPVECEAGDVVFMSGFTVHRTGPGTGFRVAVSQRFDNVSEPTFIERGYPCAQRRVVDREIKWKPTVEQVQKVFS